MFIVVAYDIIDDKQRNRVAKAHGRLWNKGTVQCLSRCVLEEEYLTEMVDTLKKHIDHKEDSIRFYILCKGCITSVKMLGKGELIEDKDVFII